MSARAAPADPRETVVLLHGLAMRPWVMGRLAWTLRTAGYRVLNLAYPSRTRPLARLAAEELPARLAAHGVARAPRLHFVAHSMGGIVLRQYCRDRRPPNLGRVVLLAPPNQGSAAADVAHRHRFLRAVLGLNLPALGTGPAGVAATLGSVDYPVGIIAGRGALNPLFGPVLGAEHDGAVSVASTRLAGMGDFLVVPHSHTAMLWRGLVCRQALAFLRRGRFTRP